MLARNLRTSALIALFAFMINVIMPFFAVYDVSSEAEAKHLTSAFGERILICTGDGFRWVKLADLQSGREKPTPHSHEKCPLCYAASHGLNSMAAASAAVALPYQRTYAHVSAHAPFLISFHRTSALRVRAPPVSFIG